MGFKAKDVVEALDYDFHPHVDARGVIAEPSTKQIRQLQSRQRAAVQRLGYDLDEDDETQTANILKIMSSLDDDQLREIQDEQIDAVSEVCGCEYDADAEEWSGGNPSRDEIVALPFRLQQAFFGWLMGEIFDPEATAVGTKPSLRVATGGKRSIGRNAS